MPMIETRDGTGIYVKTWGQGRPVVLIHGWPLSGASWDPVSNALANSGFKAIAYDRRGFGRSDQPSDGYDYDTFADDLADVITQCAGGEPVALVGFSMGGGEIARYMSRHGGRNVSRAVLISSVVPYMLKTNDNPEGVSQEIFDKMTQGILEDRPHFMRGFLRDFYGVGFLERPVSADLVDASWGLAMQAGLRPTLLAAKAFASTDFRADLASFTTPVAVPTLVIHGTGDKTVPIDATGREVARLVPHAQLLEYPGEPHGVFGTQQQRLIDDLTGFLQGHDVETERAQAVSDMLVAEEMLSLRSPI